MDAILSVLVGLVAIPVISFLKSKFGLSGPRAQLLSAAVAVVLAAVYLAATGALFPVSIDTLAAKAATQKMTSFQRRPGCRNRVGSKTAS